MKAINLSFTIVWLVLGLVCLGGVIFMQAYWHYGTTAMCLILSWLFYSEYNNLKIKKSW